MILPVRLGKDSYDITVERGALARVGEIFALDRKVLVVTDSGVPAAYADAVASACREAVRVTVPAGEESKNLDNYARLLSTMLSHGFTRSDAVVAVGGGVVGDLSGFAAACYMRGIDFYNVPTTLLSELDSSVGGKTAVDLDGVKNTVGAFHQPKAVLIDPDVLDTLDDRQFRSGLAEAIKMAATSDAALFSEMEKMRGNDFRDRIEEIVIGSLRIKIAVVEEDEREDGPRRILNFGHTVGHAIESASEPARTHGECVAIGMLPMASGKARERIRALLEAVGLPTACGIPADKLIGLVLHDKKLTGDTIGAVYVDEIGKGVIRREKIGDFEEKIREGVR